MRFSYPASISAIVDAQNPDGGWGYEGKGSWTEPTAYALLAQIVAGNGNSPEFRRGLTWLAGSRRPDGGWSPRPSVDQSTWVTALVVLLLAEHGRVREAEAGVRWLLRQTGRESSFLYRLRLALLGVKSDTDGGFRGWPWYPETAAWVAPTAIAVLALGKYDKRAPDPTVRERIAAGKRFLMSRMCADGGWNHGSSRALGYEGSSYPETTGLALLALDGVPAAQLKKSIGRAERHLKECRSAEGVSWLRLGLLAHAGREVSLEASKVSCRTVVDASLCVLADAAVRGRNVFLG